MTIDKTCFLLGAAGTGKTTAVQHRLLHLLQSGEPAYTLLTLVAEPEHADQYLEMIHQSGLGPYADLKIITYARLAQEMVFLFWPLIARDAGFEKPFQPPTLLSYDLAQLLMWRTVTPMLADGAFADLRLRPQQIVSQLLDTLNRSALNGLSLSQAVQRQINTWTGEPERIRHLQDAETAVHNFRQFCRANSLVDLSLVVRVFDVQVVQHPDFHRYFSERYRHLIVDNLEEQTPAGQKFIRWLMGQTETAVLVYDEGGGYKRFMAADPKAAVAFRSQSRRVLTLDHSFLSSEPLTHLANLVENHLQRASLPTIAAPEAILGRADGRYRREMIHALIPQLHALIHEQNIPPADIAIIAPYLDGALRYTLTQSLREAGLPYTLLRRRSSPREEPRVRAWLTWLALAHPDWDIRPTGYDVAEALTLSMAGLDPARAALLAQRLYPDGRLLPVTELMEGMVERVGERAADLYEDLREWLVRQDGRQPLDAFLYALFNELLCQPRFQPEPDLAGAAVCDWLVQAATRLRQAAPAMGLDTPDTVGRAFIEGINQGLVTARPPEMGEPPDPDGILISTTYGYLLTGRPTTVQVWLETAATGWWDIPNQPLSNAFVLAQSWPDDAPWTAPEDGLIRNQLLSRVIRGLTARCSKGIILANSDLDRRGQRQEGPLWRALAPALNAPMLT